VTEARDRAWFEALYEADPDPWRFATSPYERGKYRATLTALPARRFRSALEVGCSVGVMTRLLARRCDRLLALDAAESALRHARRRRRGLAGVTVARATLPQEWPPGRFDLIVLSEVLYFLSAAEVRRVAEATWRSLLPGGIAVLVDWRGPTGTALGGEQAAGLFLRQTSGRWRKVTLRRRPGYRLDVLRRPR
jgi:SAM-dependent methyltransferase